MRGGGVAVANGFLTCAGDVHRLPRQGDFDEFLPVGHAAALMMDHWHGPADRQNGSSD